MRRCSRQSWLCPICARCASECHPLARPGSMCASSSPAWLYLPCASQGSSWTFLHLDSAHLKAYYVLSWLTMFKCFIKQWQLIIYQLSVSGVFYCFNYITLKSFIANQLSCFISWVLKWWLCAILASLMSLCQCWLHSSWCTPVLTLLCCQSPIMVPGGAGGWSPAEARCVNIFSIILRTFILVLSTALLAREHNNTSICWPGSQQTINWIFVFMLSLKYSYVMFYPD